MTQNNTKQPRLTQKQFNWLIVSGFLVILVLLYDFYVADNIRFYANWVRCGQRPVGTAGKGFLGSGVPHYIDQPLISGFRDVIDYECSPLEAERAGYSADPDKYRFPHKWELGEFRKSSSR